MATFSSTVLPILKGQLKGYLTVIEDAKKYLAANPNGSTTEESLVGARLIADMLDAKTQTLCPVGGFGSLLFSIYGVERLSYPDWQGKSVTLDDLAIIPQYYLDQLEKVDPAGLDAALDKPIHLFDGGHYNIDVPNTRQFIVEYLIPNTFFHLVTFYDIFRAQGVPLGKDLYCSSWFSPAMTKAWAENKSKKN